MENQTERRLKEIEDRLKNVQHSLEGILPIWNQVDRKVKSLQAERERLENEKERLTQGELPFDLDLDF
jgi:archaellum component FlaC